jgi:pyruvate dehydrogenase E2 component (dihydrolipoamide acetyltransferase)
MAAETFDFTMPSLGADMDEGKLIEWLVKPGDVVTKGDTVAVVDTAKAAIEVESFRSGVVERLMVEPGTTVAVGTPLATLSAREAPAEPTPPVPAAPAPPAPVTVPEPVAAPPRPVVEPTPAPPRAAPAAGPLIRKLAAELDVDLQAVQGSGRRGMITRADVKGAATTRSLPAPYKISPYARRLAEEVGVDLADVQGTGRGGAVRADDIRAAAARVQPPSTIHPAEAERPDSVAQRAAAMRQVTARLMARSKREIPHYYLSQAVDVTDTLAWLRERNRQLPVPERILPAALFLRATTLAALRVPALNGLWVDDQFVAGDGVKLGVAVAMRGGGLVTPAIADADELGLAELMTVLRDLATRARSGRLRGSELTGATITVTNLGDLGVESVYGVIYPPQVALVGVGKVVSRPWAVDGLLGVRSVTTLTLSADHRATDGNTGARFLDAIDQVLSQPDTL